MANPFTEPQPRVLRLSRSLVLMVTAVAVCVSGTIVAGAAAAAGIHSPELLVLIFGLGASTTLFLLVLWYLAQVSRGSGAPAYGPSQARRDPDAVAPWTPLARQSSGSTIMWAANAFRRRSAR